MRGDLSPLFSEKRNTIKMINERGVCMPPTTPPVQAPKAGNLAVQEMLTARKEGEHPFTILYQQYVERIYRYHLVRAGNVEEAQDLTSETFHAALESFAAYDPAQGCAAAWLTGIARHKLVDYFRRSRRALSITQIEDQPDQATSLEEASAQRLQMAQVSAVLRKLPADRAEALSLHFFAGLTLSETAQVMRRNEEAVKKLIHRGLADLRRYLAYPPTATASVEVNV
jgi:RNA polymerase sigma-70 factor (ECF subfamily)